MATKKKKTSKSEVEGNETSEKSDINSEISEKISQETDELLNLGDEKSSVFTDSETLEIEKEKSDKNA